MRTVKIFILVCVFIAAGFLVYALRSKLGFSEAPPIPPPDEKTLEEFSTLAPEGKSFTYLLPISKETPLTVDGYNLITDRVTLIIKPTFPELAVSHVVYADGRSGHKIHYVSKATLEEELGAIMGRVITPEYPKASSFLRDGGAYIKQIRDEITIFIEIETSDGGVSVDLFSVEI